MLVLARRPPAARGRRGAVGRAAPAPDRRAARSSACTCSRGLTSASSAGSSRGARALRVGDPADPRIQVGPLASARRAEHVARARRGGGRAGSASSAAAARVSPPGCEAGAFYAPAVITGATHEMRLMREPIDGPVLAVVAVDSVDEAIALANDSDYGLGASVWTADRYQGMRIARELHAGMVWLNDHLPGPTVSRGPWGAAAGGGLGRTLGAGRAAGVRAGEAHHLGPARRRAGLWWGPYDEATSARRARWRSMRSARESDRERAWREGARRARARGRARARAGPAEGLTAVRCGYGLSHARPGLRRQGVRLPAAQGNLRPELRPGDARDALLHRLPEARPAGAAWSSAAARSGSRRSRGCSPATARSR